MTVASVAPDAVRICAWIWSYVIVSVQCGWYQKVSRESPLGIATDCVRVLLPFTGFGEPSWADQLPEWPPEWITGVNAPLVVQPLRFAVSKPPFVTPCAGTVTVSEMLVACVALAPVPVTVIVYGPGAVDEPTLTVIVEEPPAVTDVGLNDTVAPDGTPLALNATDCAEPLVTAVEIADVPLAPWLTLTPAGDAEIEKSFGGGTVTVSETLVACVALAPVPVTVIVYGPAAVDEPTLTVIVEEPPAATDVGLNDTVAPDGTPLALNATDCAEPLVTAVEIADVPLAPWLTLTPAGDAEIEKSFGGGTVTVSATLVECVALAPVPVTVIVYGPAAVDEPTLTVIVEEPPAVTDVGLNDTVAPDGTPLALNATYCSVPLVTAVDIIDVPLAPWLTLTPAGYAEIEKS